MKQPIFTPKKMYCAICGAAKVVDWNSNMMYSVMCDNNHCTGEYTTIHRAICGWDDAQEKIKLDRKK